MIERYFAYGSNLKGARLAERVPGVRTGGIARLAGYEVACNKPGRDGTAKANLVARPDAVVWGVVYTLPSGGFDVLDAFEGGYVRLEVRVEDRDGKALTAVTYRSALRTQAPVDPEYLALMVEGAREHALPDDYVRALQALG